MIHVNHIISHSLVVWPSKLLKGASLCIVTVASSEVLLPDRKYFTAHLDNTFDKMEQKVKNTLDAVSFVCTKADVWTAYHKSFFGMTVHWIDTFKAVISCLRLHL